MFNSFLTVVRLITYIAPKSKTGYGIIHLKLYKSGRENFIFDGLPAHLAIIVVGDKPCDSYFFRDSDSSFLSICISFSSCLICFVPAISPLLLSASLPIKKLAMVAVM